MQRPTTKANYTQEELSEYAQWRKNQALQTLETLAGTPAAQSGEQSLDECEEYREPISITKQTVVKIQLSWGGDGDGYLLTYDDQGELTSGVYYWEDWFAYEEVPLTTEERELVQNAYSIDGLVEAT